MMTNQKPFDDNDAVRAIHIGHVVVRRLRNTNTNETMNATRVERYFGDGHLLHSII